jgi:hypothetical protein
VLVSEPSSRWPKTTYAHIWKDDQGCYIQDDAGYMLRISTVHKPCHACGTGFQYTETGYNSLSLIEYIEKAAKTSVPYRFGDRHYEHVKKYKNAEDFKKCSQVLKYIDVIL